MGWGLANFLTSLRLMFTNNFPVSVFCQSKMWSFCSVVLTRIFFTAVSPSWAFAKRALCTYILPGDSWALQLGMPPISIWSAGACSKLFLTGWLTLRASKLRTLKTICKMPLSYPCRWQRLRLVVFFEGLEISLLQSRSINMTCFVSPRFYSSFWSTQGWLHQTIRSFFCQLRGDWKQSNSII